MAGLPRIYKQYQGQYTRSITAVVLAALTAMICYFVWVLLVKYLPTETPKTVSVKNVNESWVLAADWPNEETPTYREGTVAGQEVLTAMEQAGDDRWSFRVAQPVPYALYYQYGIPSLLFALVAVGVYKLVNRENFADFLIATEGEMKKVSWSSKAELIGSTAVVIVTVIIMAVLIYVADFVWTYGFVKVGVLPSQ